ncbi:MAG: hypothetical protein IPM71_14715 [Bacteroidota bacterium]|nr:MAG: hypothetical protein IPM71_14715 [Bacteroidota bacterium]
MKQILYAIGAIALLFSSCSQQDELINSGNDDLQLKRMPYFQRTFLLDNLSGNANIYEVEYDFQGLRGDAVISPFAVVSGQSHMAVSPDKKWLTVVGNGNGKVTLVNIENPSLVKVFTYANGARPLITQVDFDQAQRLFIAGNSGFLYVHGTGADLSSNIWELADGAVLGISKYVAPQNIHDFVEAYGEDSNEDYFNDNLELVGKKVKFNGGDILFTQNATETGGIEQEYLISFTRAYGGAAVLVTVNDYNIAGRKLFNLKYQKVTGAALVGDNFLMASSFGTNNLVIYSMHGDIVAEPNLILNGSPFTTSNGDMASTQTFDLLSNPASRIIGDTLNSFYPWFPGTVLAEMKLFRPGYNVSDNYEVDETEDPSIWLKAERNSSNADLADIRVTPHKFMCLGVPNGMVVMRFPDPVTVTESTRLYVAESSWYVIGTNNQHTLPYYEDKAEAYAATQERAKVYVSAIGERYIGSWVDAESNWTYIGDAYANANYLELPAEANGFQWIRIIDDSHPWSFTGYDLNFVGVFNQ